VLRSRWAVPLPIAALLESTLTWWTVWPLFTRLSLVNSQLTAAELGAVEPLDSGASCLFRHLYETEATGATSLFVEWEVNISYLSYLAEKHD
jgi:hypothetical protein